MVASRRILDEERLKDPCHDRVVPIDKCPLPPQRELTVKRVYESENEKPDYELISDYLYEEGKLTKECALEILSKS